MAINEIPCLRWNEKLALLYRAADASALCALSPLAIQDMGGRRLRNLDWKTEDFVRKAEGLQKILVSRNIRLLAYPDSAYPPQLREICDPPFLLFCRGGLPAWDVPCLAIVGTRRPSAAGRRAAWQTAGEAAARGVTVVSGLALGIDGEAHRGCLDAGGKTIAVLGNGADTVSPASHRALASRILDSGGLIMTEYAPRAGVRRYYFPGRNRIISGISRAVLVAEAPAKSGALITAGYALQQGRGLYLHAGCLHGANAEGCRGLAEKGASVARSFSDIIRGWSGENTNAPFFQERENAHGHSPGKAQALFLEEELAGNLTRHQGNYFRRTQDG
jgi:DNA processing protein